MKRISYFWYKINLRRLSSGQTIIEYVIVLVILSCAVVGLVKVYSQFLSGYYQTIITTRTGWLGLAP